MNGCHIAIFTEMGNGHIYPVLPLASELAKRGNHVTYPSSEFYMRGIRESGAVPIPFKNSSPDTLLQSLVMKTFEYPDDRSIWWQMIGLYKSYFFKITEELTSQLEPFYSRNLPDLILYDPSTIAGRMLATRLNCRATQIRQHFVPRKNYLMREAGVFINPPQGLEFAHDIDLFLRRHGIPIEDYWWHAETLSIQLIPEEFQFCREELDGRYHFVGALVNRKYSPNWKDRSNGRAVVLISDFSGLQVFGEKSHSYYKMFIDGLAGSEHYYILSVSSRIDSDAFGVLPENFEINRHSSHLEILPNARLLVCHGGMLSTLESLYHGVPVLGIPLSPGTEEVSFRTSELGLGRCLSRSGLSADQISVEVPRLLNDSGLKKKCEEMKGVFNRCGGKHLAADLIEKALSEAF